MRLLSLLLFFVVFVPIGWTRKLLRRSAFAEPAFRRTSSWQSARLRQKRTARKRARPDRPTGRWLLANKQK